MTFAEREAIFSKEMLTIKDISALYDVSPSMGSVIILNMKRALGKVRYEISGKIHILDYLDYLEVQKQPQYLAIYGKVPNVRDKYSSDPTGFFSGR